MKLVPTRKGIPIAVCLISMDWNLKMILQVLGNFNKLYQIPLTLKGFKYIPNSLKLFQTHWKEFKTFKLFDIDKVFKSFKYF